MNAQDTTILSRVKHRIGQAIAIGVLAAVVLGPPAWVVSKILSGGPLWATRTVTYTTTQHYGVIPDAGAILGPWLVFLVIGYALVSGAFPRFI